MGRHQEPNTFASMKRKRILLAGLVLSIIVVAMLVLRPTPTPPARVHAVLETAPVPSQGDAADDPAIWRHPVDARRSTIIGTDKDSGLAVYDLNGRQLQFLPHGRMNNVDLREGFPLGGRRVALVTCGNQSDSTVAIYRVADSSGVLEEIAARTIVTCPPYGSCMYRSRRTGKYYYFVNSRQGAIEQWELFDDGTGKVDASRVRAFDIGLRPEGCVADDELGFLYLGVEEQGIRKYSAEPGGGEVYTMVDQTRPRGRLERQVEGLAIYVLPGTRGYLIASCQGTNAFNLYRREGRNDYLGTFQIVAGNGIDEVTHTDGIEVSSFNFGPRFPAGLFVAQDDANDGGNQNFKVVPWEAIVAAVKSPAAAEHHPASLWNQ